MQQDILTNVIRFNGIGCLRQRLALSMVTQKPIFINNIKRDTSYGIKDYESNLLKLLDQMMNGSTIQINENGTSIYFKPGTIIGGKINHKCNNDRDIGYYLECIFWILPLMKKDLDLTLEGITNGYEDPSIDKLKLCVLPILKRFGLGDEITLNIIKRAAAPLGGGVVKLYCPVVKKLNPVNINQIGYVQKIRGVAFSMRVSPTMSNRIIDGAKLVLNNFLSDVFIHQDHCKVNGSGNSPGFGVALVAETTSGLFITSESSSIPKQKKTQNSDTLNETYKILTPEEIGQNAALDLLDNIKYVIMLILLLIIIAMLY